MLGVVKDNTVITVGNISKINRILTSKGKPNIEEPETFVVIDDFTITKIKDNTPPSVSDPTRYFIVNNGYKFDGEFIVIDFVEQEFTQEMLDYKASVILKARLQEAEALRSKLESEAFVEVQGHPVNLTDTAIYNLQAYILANIEPVVWKCDDGAFVTLTLDDMRSLLSQLMIKKNELFAQEALA